MARPVPSLPCQVTFLISRNRAVLWDATPPTTRRHPVRRRGSWRCQILEGIRWIPSDTFGGFWKEGTRFKSYQSAKKMLETALGKFQGDTPTRSSSIRCCVYQEAGSADQLIRPDTRSIADSGAVRQDLRSKINRVRASSVHAIK
jgi:hypothetical protein